jgi:hypothetical protein
MFMYWRFLEQQLVKLFPIVGFRETPITPSEISFDGDDGVC